VRKKATPYESDNLDWTSYISIPLGRNLITGQIGFLAAACDTIIPQMKLRTHLDLWRICSIGLALFENKKLVAY